MSSSSSEQDISEGSNLEAQLSQEETSDSSPAQQVPNLRAMSRIPTDDVSMHKDDKRPWLRVIEQPQEHFRFRYKSERECGSHGCLMGSTTISAARTYPTVELMNYAGSAVVKCRLFTEDKAGEHPHQLVENDQENGYIAVVPEQGSYKVCFRGMGIIHTAKKDLLNALVKKRLERSPNDTKKEIKRQCKDQANSVNLNVVLLRFSAHDIDTDQEICSEYSWPIKNMKSPATNPLKICRYSRAYGRANGGDDVYLFVEKVSKKNIKVRMFEVDANNSICWWAWASFMEGDVHHQYGIVIRTPLYDGPTRASKVKVSIELVRTTDGRTSAPKDYWYTNENFKKRKINQPTSNPQLSTTVPGSSGLPSLIAGEPPHTPRVILRRKYCDRRLPWPARLDTQIKPETSDPTEEWPRRSGSQLTPISGLLGPHKSVLGDQQTNASRPPTSRELGYQRTSTQVSQASCVLGPQAEVFQTPGVLGPQQNSAHVSYNPGVQLYDPSAQVSSDMLIGETISNDDFILPTTSEHAVLTQQPNISEDSSMIIVGSTISENITHEYSVMPILPDLLSPDALDEGSEATMVSAIDPMMGYGNPNVIDLPGIMNASNVGGTLSEYAQFQANSGLNIEGYYLSSFDLSQFQGDVADSGRPKEDIFASESKGFLPPPERQGSNPSCEDVKTELFGNRRQPFDVSNLESDTRPVFKPEDVVRVKKLIKEIYQNPGTTNELEMSEKLEQLCDIRMSNGDTFLHMTLSDSRSSFENIVSLIHSMKMPHLLNFANDLQQTILHLAVIHDQPRLVAFLVAKGCDPMMDDHNGNNVIHHAVMYENSLESLIAAIKSNDVGCDFEAFNYEKQTALHLAAIYDSEASARLLLRHGASYNARDSEGRTPLHLATYDDNLGVARALIDSVLPRDVDAADHTGRTALQIACGGDIKKNSFEIIKLLLEKGADPFKQEGKNKPAMELAKRTPKLWQFLNEQIISSPNLSEDSELEEEFFSADEEGESEDLD